jgi:hypothetical protein
LDLEGHFLDKITAIRHIQHAFQHPTNVHQLTPAGGQYVGRYGYRDAPVMLRAWGRTELLLQDLRYSREVSFFFDDASAGVSSGVCLGSSLVIGFPAHPFYLGLAGFYLLLKTQTYLYGKRVTGASTGRDDYFQLTIRLKPSAKEMRDHNPYPFSQGWTLHLSRLFVFPYFQYTSSYPIAHNTRHSSILSGAEGKEGMGIKEA